MAAKPSQNGGFQGAMQAAFTGRGGAMSGLVAAGDYSGSVAAANAFALQVLATVTDANVTTADQQALLANICAGALAGSPILAVGAAPNAYLPLVNAIAEAYSLAKADLTV
jgi:hypothetical protein